MHAAETPSSIDALLGSEEIQVINLGLERFAETFAAQKVRFVQVDWQPPAAEDQDLSDMLSALRGKS